ncbi:phosphate signaling complex protein PhoU [Natrinema altunense]|uniref:Phosphate-specific transport system accessory protein PhoU n=1 Tax=Natrinema altunense (strain JCM 12890 / CGMCC 1.3731 / AJ2) TaxID=1227494 RepID=L9ZPE0_NATA2|nr:phosphate signaling complex protein PhoU [Natrinema altunense]ELY86993.1 phosphate transport system regulatory protein PhoU [Natrinema altunense JCM 12890]
MTREDYRARLERLRDAVVAIGDRVHAQLDDAVTALFTDDRALARAVIASDDAVNDRSLELERECLDLLALHQPVAGDLRFVVAAFKIVTDLERIGDLATNLAAYTLDSTGSSPPLPDVDFERLAALALEQVERALEAFVADDVEACFDIADRDDELDGRCASVTERIVRTLIERRIEDGRRNGGWLRDGDSRPPVEDVITDVSRTFVIVRDLERVGDHAVNVAARTVYALENSEELLV